MYSSIYTYRSAPDKVGLKRYWGDHMLDWNNKLGNMKDGTALAGSSCDGDLENNLYLQLRSTATFRNINSYLSWSICSPVIALLIFEGRNYRSREQQNWYWLPNQEDFASQTYRCLSRRTIGMMCLPSALFLRLGDPYPVSSQNNFNHFLAHTSYYIQEKWWRK